MKFFFDNNLSPHLARAIAALSKENSSVREVVHLKDRFAPNIPDVEWIGHLAHEGGWIVISQDHYKKHRLEREALKRGGLITFVLEPNWSRQTFWPIAQNLVRWWPAIIEQSARRCRTQGALCRGTPYRSR